MLDRTQKFKRFFESQRRLEHLIEVRKTFEHQ